MFESIHFESKGRATTNASKPEVLEKLREIVGEENVVVDPERVEPYGADAVKEKFGTEPRQFTSLHAVNDPPLLPPRTALERIQYDQIINTTATIERGWNFLSAGR